MTFPVLGLECKMELKSAFKNHSLRNNKHIVAGMGGVVRIVETHEAVLLQNGFHQVAFLPRPEYRYRDLEIGGF